MVNTTPDKERTGDRFAHGIQTILKFKPQPGCTGIILHARAHDEEHFTQFVLQVAVSAQGIAGIENIRAAYASQNPQTFPLGISKQIKRHFGTLNPVMERKGIGRIGIVKTPATALCE